MGDWPVLRSGKGFFGFHLAAMDGSIGTVRDLFIDAHRWAVRYLVVDTGGWLSGRRVLISPIAVGGVHWEEESIEVRLSRKQVENAPDVDVDRPVSRQMEIAFFRHFGWGQYWLGPDLWGASQFPAPLAATPLVDAAVDVPTLDDHGGDPHLRSLRELGGYEVKAADGDVGRIDNVVVEDDTWRVRYVAATTGSWWSGKLVLLAPEWLRSIDWASQSITLACDLPRRLIRGGPVWDPSRPIDRAFEERLFAHYGRTAYWRDDDNP